MISVRFAVTKSLSISIPLSLRANLGGGRAVEVGAPAGTNPI
jgi:hypothetical protein